MRVAALDYGRARIGVAVADELGLFAHARPPISAEKKKAALAAIAALAKEERIDRFLVGLPLSLRGEAGASAERAEAFAHDVARATRCEVELVDERLTTVAAHRELRASGVSAKKSRGKVDGVAACLMLQAWLDARANL